MGSFFIVEKLGAGQNGSNFGNWSTVRKKNTLREHTAANAGELDRLRLWRPRSQLPASKTWRAFIPKKKKSLGVKI